MDLVIEKRVTGAGQAEPGLVVHVLEEPLLRRSSAHNRDLEDLDPFVNQPAAAIAKAAVGRHPEALTIFLCAPHREERHGGVAFLGAVRMKRCSRALVRREN